MKILRRFKELSRVKKVLVLIAMIPTMLFALLFAGAIVSIVNDNSNSTETNNSVTNEYTTIPHGELLSVITADDVMVIKAKINDNLNNNMTIKQNGYNVEDFVLKNDMSNINELQYWAVADMNDGSESKVVSFTLDKNMINSIKNKSLFGNNIVNTANDVWIHPSLNN